MSNLEKSFDSLYAKYKSDYPEIFDEYDSGNYTKKDVLDFFRKEEKKKQKRDEIVIDRKYLEIEEYCNNNKLGKDFSELMVSYSEYITSVIEHVSYSQDFVGSSSPSSRVHMESLNSARINRHNDAIQRTMSLNNELIGAGHVFYPDFFDVDKISSINQDRRDKFGDFIFSFQNARARIIRKRDKEQRENNFFSDIKSKTKPIDIANIEKVERDYRVSIPSKVDDLKFK